MVFSVAKKSNPALGESKSSVVESAMKKLPG